MKEDSLNFPGGGFIAHDIETIRFIYHTMARMLFPEQEQDKRRRNRFLNHLGVQKSKAKKPDPRSILDEVTRENAKGCVVGECFRIQSLLSFQWEIAPSIRFLEYAAKQGLILKEWEAKGYPVKQMRHIYRKFEPVRHLWCADIYIKTMYCKTGTPNYSLQCLWTFPGYFLGLAEVFREWAAEVDLPRQKTKLWMPKGWRSIAKSPKLDMAIISGSWEQQRRSLEKLWQWYDEGQEWQASRTKKLGQKKS